MNLELTNKEFTMVTEAIASRMGLHFPLEKWDMLNRNLVSAASEFGFKDVGVFINWFLSTSLNSEQIEILASHLTISETYFWREPQVFDAFTKSVLTELATLKKDNEKSINIWCTACSTGEEAYSIAIALHKTIPEIKEWKITILATDINPKALSKAKTGVYSSWSFRNSPPWLKSKYFKSLDNKEFEIIPEIKEMVTFTSFNLTHENFLSSICKNQKMDIIFCRNVLMYFTIEWVNQITQNLYHSMSDEGWMIVSSCELSNDLFPQLTPVNFPGAVLYRKSKLEFQIQNNYCLSLAGLELFNSTTFCHSNNDSFESVSDTDPLYAEIAENINIQTEALKNIESTILEIAAPLPFEISREAILNEDKNTIRLLANQGRLEEALWNCDNAIASYLLSPELYFLKASILQEMDKKNEAIKSLKKAIYIDPNYIMGHFTLGNLFQQQGIHKIANQYFNNALELLNTNPNNNFFCELEGLSASYLKGIIIHNLQIQVA